MPKQPQKSDERIVKVRQHDRIVKVPHPVNEKDQEDETVDQMTRMMQTPYVRTDEE